MVSGRLFICLCLGFILLFACDKADKVKEQASPTTVQLVNGTLPVRIDPEAPTSTDNLRAVFSGKGRITYNWEKNGAILENENAPSLTKSHFKKQDKITVIVQAGSAKGTATVVIGNAPPRITSISFIPTNIYRGVDITAVPVAFDPDGDEVHFDYKWSVNSEQLPESSPVLKGDRFKRGDSVSLVVIPSDSEGSGLPFKTAAVTIPKSPPRFISTPPLEFSGNIYSYKAVASDPDVDPITYSLASAPRGMIIDAKTGKITWRITSEDEGTHIIKIVAGDSEGNQAIQQYSLDIRLNGGTKQ